VFSSFCMLIDVVLRVGASRRAGEYCMVDGINDRPQVRHHASLVEHRRGRTRRRRHSPRKQLSQDIIRLTLRACGRSCSRPTASSSRRFTSPRYRWLHPGARARTGRRRTRAPSTVPTSHGVHAGVDRTRSRTLRHARRKIDAGRPGPGGVRPGTHAPVLRWRLRRLDVSFTKGCFTGQELVGRLDARGSSVPWRMVRASGPSESAPQRGAHVEGSVRHCGTHDLDASGRIRRRSRLRTPEPARERGTPPRHDVSSRRLPDAERGGPLTWGPRSRHVRLNTEGIFIKVSGVTTEDDALFSIGLGRAP